MCSNDSGFHILEKSCYQTSYHVCKTIESLNELDCTYYETFKFRVSIWVHISLKIFKFQKPRLFSQDPTISFEYHISSYSFLNLEIV